MSHHLDRKTLTAPPIAFSMPSASCSAMSTTATTRRTSETGTGAPGMKSRPAPRCSLVFSGRVRPFAVGSSPSLRSPRRLTSHRDLEFVRLGLADQEMGTSRRACPSDIDPGTTGCHADCWRHGRRAGGNLDHPADAGDHHSWWPCRVHVSRRPMPCFGPLDEGCGLTDRCLPVLLSTPSPARSWSL